MNVYSYLTAQIRDSLPPTFPPHTLSTRDITPRRSIHQYPPELALLFPPRPQENLFQPHLKGGKSRSTYLESAFV